MHDFPPDAHLIIRCPPAGVDNLPSKLRVLVEQQVSILHTKIPCTDCGKDCWIGPGQMSALVEGKDRARPVCWICIVRDPVHLRNVLIGGNSFVARPETAQAPRRKDP